MNRVISGINENKFDNIEDKKCLVLLSSYNGEKYIEEQINSILHQKNVEVNLLIRDDGSTDNTKNILKSFKNNYPEQIDIIYGKNKGIHESFKQLIEQANLLFDYYSFADQDDIWDCDKLIKSVVALNHYDCDFYSCAARLVDSNNVSMGRDTSKPEKFLYYMNGNSKVLTPGAQGCTIVITNKIMKYLLSKGIPACYGHDTWIPIVAYYMFDCIYDSDTHMDYRQHNSSWTGNRNNRIKQFAIETNYYFKGLSRYKRLAKDILNNFNSDLNDDDKRVLHAIAAEKMNIFERIKAISAYKFGKYGWKENLFYKIYYILGF